MENQYDKKVEHLIDFKVQNKIKTKIFQLIPYQMGAGTGHPNGVQKS